MNARLFLIPAFVVLAFAACPRSHNIRADAPSADETADAIPQPPETPPAAATAPTTPAAAGACHCRTFLRTIACIPSIREPRVERQGHRLQQRLQGLRRMYQEVRRREQGLDQRGGRGQQ